MEDYEAAKPQPKSGLSPLARLLLLLSFILAAIALLTSYQSNSSHHHPQTWILGTEPANKTVVEKDKRFLLNQKGFKEQLPQTRNFVWILTESVGAPDGEEKHMLLVNGLYPGPTIEVNEGDRVIVRVINRLAKPTSIHWHGLYQRGTNFYDGSAGITQCGIPPSESLVYDFELDGWTGTTWWHAHYGTQYTDGLSGSFIVHGRNESIPLYDEDLIVQMADNYHAFSPELTEKYLSPTGIDGTPGDEPVPNSGAINGIGQWGSYTKAFQFNLVPGSTYRFRLLNVGSFAPFLFSIENHSLLIVEADGTPVVPYEVNSLQLAVGQRYSVIVKLDQNPGAYWMRATMIQDMFRYTQPGISPDILGVIRYGCEDCIPGNIPNPLLGPGDLDEYSLVPAEVKAAPDSTLSYFVGVTSQKTSNGRTLMFLNRTSWEPLEGTTTLFSSLGFDKVGAKTHGDQFIVTLPDTPPVVDLIVQNFDDGSHPFHLHGYKIWIVGKGVGRYRGQQLNIGNKNPMRRDTVFVPAYHWVALRFVADNPGVWAFHCHTAWHMASGLLMQFVSMPSATKLLSVPPEMLDQCSRQRVKSTPSK